MAPGALAVLTGTRALVMPMPRMHTRRPDRRRRVISGEYPEAWNGPGAPQAVSPSGSGKPFARQQAVSVFASRQAMVIGPTPPGTGVIAPATAAALA